MKRLQQGLRGYHIYGIEIREQSSVFFDEYSFRTFTIHQSITLSDIA
jgi:hypothetical protein